MINLVPYNSDWPNLFKEEASKIKLALGNNCIIVHHIGSTAVPGLASKPIIDMLPVVKNILEVRKNILAMQNLGYEFKGEYGIPFRQYFIKGNPVRLFNVHVYEQGNSEIDRHLLFRDYIRTHSKTREAYEALKLEMLQKYPNDIDAYTLGKNAFIEENVDAKTGFDGLRMVEAATDREWKAYRGMLQPFFDSLGVEPLQKMNPAEHRHFVLIKGVKFVAAAYIELKPFRKAELKVLVMEQGYKTKGLESECLHLINRWIEYNELNNQKI